MESNISDMEKMTVATDFTLLNKLTAPNKVNMAQHIKPMAGMSHQCPNKFTFHLVKNRCIVMPFDV